MNTKRERAAALKEQLKSGLEHVRGERGWWSFYTPSLVEDLHTIVDELDIMGELDAVAINAVPSTDNDMVAGWEVLISSMRGPARGQAELAAIQDSLLTEHQVTHG